MDKIKSLIIKKEFLIIACCVLLAVFFIFDHIAGRAFWGDEAGVANIIGNSFSRLYQKAIIDAHPLFYIYLIKIWSIFFGNSEFALRSFSALFALLLIIFIYPIGTFIFNSKKVGLLATFLTSTNYFLIFWATQVKVYTFAASISLLSYYFFIKLTRGAAKINYFLYVFFTLIGLYSHPWFFLVFASQFAWLIIFRNRIKNSPAKILLAQIIIGLFSLPGVYVTFYQGELGVNSWIEKAGPGTLFQSLGYLGFGSSWIYLIFSFLAILLIFSKNASFRENNFEGAANIIVGIFYLAFTLILAFIISWFKPVYVAGRYEMVILPAFILILASLWAKINYKYILASAVLLLVVFAYKNVADDRNFVKSFNSDDRRIAANLIAEAADSDIFISTDLNWSVFRYYFDHLNNLKKNINLISFPSELSTHPGWKNIKAMLLKEKDYEKEATKLMEDLKLGKKKIFVLYKKDNVISEILLKKINENFNLIETKEPTLPHGSTWLDQVLIYQTRPVFN